jgi:hypothetical protein
MSAKDGEGYFALAMERRLWRTPAFPEATLVGALPPNCDMGSAMGNDRFHLVETGHAELIGF